MRSGLTPASALMLALLLALAGCRPAQQVAPARQQARLEQTPAAAPAGAPLAVPAQSAQSAQALPFVPARPAQQADGPGQSVPTLAVGRPFPPFMLDFIAPGAARQALRGKTVVLNIWASWCPPCRREMPGLDQLSRKLDPGRFVVLGLSTDDDAAAAAEFVTQSAIGFANFLDQGGHVTRRLGTDAYPVTFVIAPDGTLLQQFEGYQDWTSPAMLARLTTVAAVTAAPSKGLGI
jgi:thiol-disulfide isomerase/thioredoxin